MISAQKTQQNCANILFFCFGAMNSVPRKVTNGKMRKIMENHTRNEYSFRVKTIIALHYLLILRGVLKHCCVAYLYTVNNYRHPIGMV